jgi:hypothetical protein
LPPRPYLPASQSASESPQLAPADLFSAGNLFNRKPEQRRIRGAWRTDQTRPPLRIWSPAGADPEVQLAYGVDDIAAALERVRAAGGHADEPGRRPDGLLADCVDDQGATFHLWQSAS